MELKKYLDEVESKLRSFDPQVSKEFAFNYIGGKVSKLEFLGLKVPQIEKAYQDGFSFLKENEEKVAEVWHYIWQNSNVYEAMSLGLRWFNDKKRKENLIQHWPLLKTWSEKIDNWAHSDELSGLYSAILERNAKVIMPTLREWGESVNPKEAVEFLKKNFESVSATAFSAAVEKLKPKEKESLKKLRKKARVQAKPMGKSTQKKPVNVKAKKPTLQKTIQKSKRLNKKRHF